MLFTKFTTDFSEKYQMPPISLTPEAKHLLLRYSWPGNVRQLKNVTEQISIIEQNRLIDADTLRKYLKGIETTKLPALVQNDEKTFSTEREILFKFLFDIKKELEETKKAVKILLDKNNLSDIKTTINSDIYQEPEKQTIITPQVDFEPKPTIHIDKNNIVDTEEVIDENLSLEDMEKELIIKALNKHKGKRKLAAEELGISERTLYRKIKYYNLDD
jgi:transcriptional regulator with PAS, ATPase and Fis domain